MGITGNGASHRVQMDAGIASANLLIAVTESDELNLLCCTVANQVANCSTIARVRTPDYSGEAAYLRDKLGLAMIINPELEAAKEISRILYLPTALEVNSFAHGQAELIKIQIPKNNILNETVPCTFHPVIPCCSAEIRFPSLHQRVTDAFSLRTSVSRRIRSRAR